MKITLDPAKLRAVRERQPRTAVSGRGKYPKKGWSKAELGRRMAPPRTASFISRLEAGGSADMKLSTLGALCTALGCGPDELIRVEDCK